MERGELVPDDRFWRWWRSASPGPDCANGFILDGFPRTRAAGRKVRRDVCRRHLREPFVVHFVVDTSAVAAAADGPAHLLGGRGDLQHIRPSAEGARTLRQRRRRVGSAAGRSRRDHRRAAGDVRGATRLLVDYYRQQGRVGGCGRHGAAGRSVTADARCKLWQAGECDEMIVCKSPAELETMHQAGLVVWEVLNGLRERVRPGVTTLDLEEFAASAHRGTRGAAGLQGLPGLSLRALRVGESGSRARDSFGVAAVCRRATSSRWISAWSTRAIMEMRR